ncbi:MAG: SURF1 family protein [Chromatiaceae bacterium]|nr:SURF1 family protein [Chromatiaceae bacterium]
MSPSIPQFQPQPIPTVAAVVLITLFIGLGFWQLERAEQKRIFADTRNARLELPPMQLTGQSTAGEDYEFRSLLAEGVFIEKKTVFIENRKHMGKNGFHVITPLQINGSDLYLLVNRGWVEAEKNRPVPAVETPGSAVKVTGTANIPHAPALDLREAELSADTNPRWPYLTLERYSQWSGLDIYPFVLLQAATDQHGFIRAWPQEEPKEGMHIGYAIQWFAFALIVSIIWLRLSWVRRTETGIRSDDES